jgi:glucuronate isomerase
MSGYIREDFLLEGKTAGLLYRRYAEPMPVFDFHNHLSAKEIATRRRFSDLAELWLESDHYKWRAMRACGVPEYYITGNAKPREKFERWAETVPMLAGSPLHHWIHLELLRYFGIDEVLTPSTAGAIWKRTEEYLNETRADCVSLLCAANVRYLCTTDDPADTLEWHLMAAKDGGIPFKVLPSFRPDRYLSGDAEAEADLCGLFGAGDLAAALTRALDRFCEAGCRVADHGFSSFGYGTSPLSGTMDMLAREYRERGIVMQLHLEPLRNNSPKLFGSYGRDAGADSIGAATDPSRLAAFLSRTEASGGLPRTILYNLNPASSRVFSTMAGNYAPDVQYGAAWWFNDTQRGIGDQLDELMETGQLARSVGMLTDSRSYTSFVRHEYYRRILCSKLGGLVDAGLYPDDTEALGTVVRNVCYRNAERFFTDNESEGQR